MGNICRSPSAEGVFRHIVTEQRLDNRILIDSAGTHAYHVGEPPDRRAQATALSRGIDLSLQVARRFDVADFEIFDYVLAMDHDNLRILRSLCPVDQQHKLSLFLAFAPHLGEEEVPDPYYGGDSGFERVLDLIEAASEGLLADIRQRYLSKQ
jgi:protein-tyrosine phosphatase